MAKITTVGELREFLCSCINMTADGTMDLDKARTAVKLAAQVNESFYSEAKVRKQELELGKAVSDLGALPMHQPISK